MLTHLSFYQKIAFTGLGLFILAAFFSVGYHHPDEHFQIIEFCNYKMGNAPAAGLSWEFNEQIRPGLPILICYGIFGFFNFLGIDNPFLLAFILRIITALLCWMVLKKIAFSLFPDFKNESAKRIFFVLIFALWFMPYISVRFSSENLASIAFLAAIYLLLPTVSDKPKKLLVLLSAGFLLGLSFYFRFQMGFAILGLGFWLLFVQRLKLSYVLVLLSGGLLSMPMCIASDYWLYSEWVLTPVNYFQANVIDDAASGWGVSPWWYYFYLFFMQAVPPIGFLLLLFFGWGLIRKPNHVFVWVMVPFLAAHFITGHKEMRFLFPMIFPLLYLASTGIDHLIATGKMKRFMRVVFQVLLVCNVLLLAFRTLAPAREIIYYYSFLYEFTATKKIQLVCLEEDIYYPSQLPISFYRSPNISTLIMADTIAFETYLLTEKPTQVYWLDQHAGQKISFEGYSQQTLYSFFPEWLTQINVNNWTAHAKIWEFKELRRQ